MSTNMDLFNAFISRNFRKFVEALEVYNADPNFHLEEKDQTIFEFILSTPNSSIYIKKCIDYGADFYVSNMKNKDSYSNYQYPLHYVINSKSIDNLKAVECLFVKTKLSDEIETKSSTYVNVKDNNGRNGLHMLAECLTNETYDFIFRMMKILLYHGCNANSPDSNERTPFLILLEKLPQLSKASEIFDYFMKNGDVDFYTHRSEEIINIVKDKYLNELPKNMTFDVNFDSMMKLLDCGEINKFETHFSSYKSCMYHIENSYTFFIFAIDYSLISIVDLLISRTTFSQMNTVSLLFRAYEKANVEIFKMLLIKSTNIYLEVQGLKKTLLHQYFDDLKSSDYPIYKKNTFIKEMTVKEVKCFDLLMKDDRCDRNYMNALDRKWIPVIYYSVRYGLDYMTMELLKKGAYIGPVITKIRKSFLENFLDSCITSNDRFHDDKEFKININYKFLMPSLNQRRLAEKDMDSKANAMNRNSTSQINKLENITVVETNVETEHKLKIVEYYQEMEPLKNLADNIDYQKLIMHPVLSSFVFLKWKKIRFSIHMNLLITLLYILTFIPFIIISRMSPREELSWSFTYKLFYGFSFTSILLLIFREFLQFLVSTKNYLRTRSNWVDLILILSTIMILFDLALVNHHLRMLHTIVILISVWEYFNLIGYLPILSISLYTKIFRKVFITFLKSMAFYSIMIVGFALSFYTLNGDKFEKDLTKYYNYTSPDIVEIPKNTSRSDRFNNFHTVGLSIIKSFVMLTGELDASNINFDGISYGTLFFLFLFIVTIVLYNLLNALAISDAQEIRSDAKFIDLHQRILSMYSHESNVYKLNPKYGNRLQEILSLFHETISDGILHMLPVENRNTYSSKMEIITNKWLPSICYFGQNMSMDIGIIQNMKTLLLTKREQQRMEIIQQFKEKRYDKLTNDIIKMNDRIVNIQNRLDCIEH